MIVKIRSKLIFMIKSPCSTMFVMFGVGTTLNPPWFSWESSQGIEAVRASTGCGEAKLQTSLELHHLGIAPTRPVQ